jgi:hypothetical protein
MLIAAGSTPNSAGQQQLSFITSVIPKLPTQSLTSFFPHLVIYTFSLSFPLFFSFSLSVFVSRTSTSTHKKD